MPDFFADPILNSPYDAPTRHWELDGAGRPTGRIVASRRRAEFVAAAPGEAAERQPDLLDLSDLTDETALQTAIAELRDAVDRWRALPNPLDWRVTPETRRLLLHWRDPNPDGLRPFFCQVEAAEVAIWLTEVAPQRARSARLLARLRGVNDAANPGLFRLALKLATGAGKTTVMAMLIAWQTVNAIRYPRRGFSRAFLVVTPGITIRDRLRVLLPNDPDSYYRERGLVPADMLADLQKARIVITNYHAFKPRQALEVSPGGKKALAGHGSELETAETEDRMVDRVCRDLEGLKDIVVINDEAHHCYRARPEASAAERGRSDAAREARENNEAARLWIAGLEAVQRQLKRPLTVYDLSATPFFLSGSGYPAGSLFPWVVSDFSLIDAIECGVVKLPRVPVSDNLPSGEAPLYRNLWPTVRDDMPSGTRGGARLDPQDLPLAVKTALDALYGHYERTFALWEREGVGVPPVFIVVCANTAASELVHEYVSGYHRTDAHEQTHFTPGRFELFSNFARLTGDPLPVPRTLLIDSREIEKGDTIDDAFRKAAAEEIDRFRRDKIAREGAAAAERITDAELLREAMNTVGRKGRLGEQIRCVVSVGMLTEGWDANTVTHILGLRAFGSRLLCEQVMGRALRRLSYALHDTPDGPRYRVEYADIMGIDGLNLAPQDAVTATPAPPRPMVRVEAVTPDRDASEIRFPRVEGYRVELPDAAIAADWSRIEPYVLTPEKVGPCEITMRGIVGAPETLTLQHLGRVRDNEIIVKLTGHLVFQKLRDGEDRPIATLIPKIKPIVRRFLDDFVDCRGGTAKAQLMHLQLADEAPRSSSAPSTSTTRAAGRSRSAPPGVHT